MAADFSAPSFSLGIDLDVDEQEAQQQQQQPPSFSLGIDLDLDEEDQQQQNPSVHNPSFQDPDDELDLDDFEEHRRPALKRLRRGLPPPPANSSITEDKNLSLDDDDIEDFSSQEDEDRRYPATSPSLHTHSMCASSKVSLRHPAVLCSQSTSKLKTPQNLPVHNASSSKRFEASSSKDMFPRLTVSPLRKIHLLDSDSDDPSSSKRKINNKEVDPSLKKKNDVPFQSVTSDEKTLHFNKHQAESFWKDFSPKENVNLATPALDEFCNEYFKSAKDQKHVQCKSDATSFCSSKVLDPDNLDDFEVIFERKNSTAEPEHNWVFPHPKPPAYQYFFHGDARIRTLVQEKLSYFTPIGAEDHRGSKQFGHELDYIGQFCPGDGPSQVRAPNTKASKRNTKTNQKRPSPANCKENSQDTGNWVNPRSNVGIPKDAGKRRVSAVGGQSGHWFTGQDGRKVYVSKNGSELTGRNAYRQYRKESGTGFSKGKKKAASKKKKK